MGVFRNPVGFFEKPNWIFLKPQLGYKNGFIGKMFVLQGIFVKKYYFCQKRKDNRLVFAGERAHGIGKSIKYLN